MSNNERPFDLLNKAVGQKVLVRLKSNMNIRGRMASFDAHMNIVLEEAEELDGGDTKAKLGTILLRGGNIIFISPA